MLTSRTWRPTVAALSALALFSCPQVITDPPPTPAKIPTTYRVLGGVSMGAIGGMAIASSNPDKFDGISSLGGPIDAAFFQRFMDDFVTSGFCSREELQALVTAHGASALNDPALIETCAAAHRGVPGNAWEHHNDFNHLHVTNNGGTFDRDSYLHLLLDLMLAYGNFLTENPQSPIAPPGLDVELVRHPPADFCSNPRKVKGLKNAEYNPDGTVDAVTFCDGVPTLYYCSTGAEPVDFCADPANRVTPLPKAMEAAYANTFCASKGGALIATKSDNIAYWLAHAGNVDTCRENSEPAPFVLAFDLNGNGRRDYGEPLVNNGHERFDDVGADGCSDAFENGNGGCNPTPSGGSTLGDPNHDDYDVDANVEGTERNWRYDEGEPFRDNGLDGVANSQDKGEGNGVYDEVEGRKRLFALDGRTNFKKLQKESPSRFARLNVMLDGGIHDIFNLGLMGKHLFTAVKLARATVGEYRDFTDIPGMADRSSGNFNPWNKSWGRVPKDLITLYGKENRTQDEYELGEGDHVGLPGQAASRFQVLFNWVAYMWPNAPRPQAVFGKSTPAEYKTETYQSQVLGAQWEYSIALPPGYGDPENANAKYPVAFLLHGYGMEPSNFVAAAVIANNYVTDPVLQLRPVIYVFPNGRCCFTNKVTGARDCRNTNDQGMDIDSDRNWERECHSGTFWVNRKGYTPTDGTPYGDALFELMGHIDSQYRTLPAAEVEAR